MTENQIYALLLRPVPSFRFAIGSQLWNKDKTVKMLLFKKAKIEVKLKNVFYPSQDLILGPPPPQKKIGLAMFFAVKRKYTQIFKKNIN